LDFVATLLRRRHSDAENKFLRHTITLKNNIHAGGHKKSVRSDE
jgi:hypothetical protein